jgi:hypothetical protein
MSSRKKCPNGCGGVCDLAAAQCVGCYKLGRTLKIPPPVLLVAPKAKPVVEPQVQVANDREQQKLKGKLTETEGKYKQALKTIEGLEAINEAFTAIAAGHDNTLQIVSREGSGTSEATPVVVASDWHAEEIVTLAQVSGLNENNLDIMDAKITRFFQATAKLIQKHLNPGVHIHDVVLALLGDFITNDIHEELVESVALKPMEAIIWVQDRMVAGINYLLNSTPYNYTVVTRVGNHSRTTKKTYFSQENGHSLEHLMYVFLKNNFRNEPRITFLIQDGYHLFLDVYDTTIRFHHGHAVKYGGGVGGITIPTLKAIAQWDDARHADLDVFGHFHQTTGNRKFKCNGSLIGYNSFGVSIKGTFEPPMQSLFLVDKRRGVTCDWPIIVSDQR